MRLLIFGASGFIGSHLARYAVTRGHDVVGLCRAGIVRDFAGPVFKWGLGELPPAAAIEGAASAIHLAHDFGGAEGGRRTLDGSLACVEHLRAAGVPRQVFFSSYSAGPHATSSYGRTKHGIEKALRGSSDIVIVRPGLVLGEGGIYGRIRRWAQVLPVIPLPDGGRGRIPVIDVGRLCSETLAIVESKCPPVEANLFEPAFETLADLVQRAAAEVGRDPIILSVPSKAVFLALRVAEILRLPLPVNADNLEGFLANQAARHLSTLGD